MDKTLDLDELERVAREEWQALLEKDDRTSLAEYPEMCLITFDEVRDLIAAARPAGINTPDMPGQFEGDIWFGDPVKRNLGTHRWENGEWVLLPSELESVLELLAVRTAQRDAALSAARPAVVSDEVETGWLIEGWDSKARALKAGWWTLEGENGGWTTDSTRALRFARKADAQAYIDDLGWTEAVPTEHQWGNPMRAALTLLPGGVVPDREAIARVIDPWGWDAGVAKAWGEDTCEIHKAEALAKADDIIAMLSTSPKEVSQ